MAFCPNFPLCGGCDCQDLTQEMQKDQKMERLHALLDPVLLQQSTPPVWEEMIQEANSVPKYYRNKIRFAFVRVGDKIWPARHQRTKPEADLPVKECFLLDPRANTLLLQIAEFAEAHQWSLYNPELGKGWLKHVLLRQAKATDQWTLMFVTTELSIPGQASLIDLLTQNFPFIKGIWQGISKGKNVDSLECTLLWGDPQIIEIIDQFQYSITPQAFFQTNSLLLPELYRTIATAAGKGKVLWDLYAGSATIGIFLANNFESVLSIESNPDNTNDANQNLVLNKISNLEIIPGKVESILNTNFIQTHSLPDVVVVDPPRAGLASELINRLFGLATSNLLSKDFKLVYISCNPVTFARDAELLISKQFFCQNLTPVDMFPHTWHQELVSTWIFKGH